MKISVVTAVFNRAATIVQAVESVKAQSWRDVEHVVIDGASTDGTVDLLTAHLGPGAKFVSEPDRGIYSALNKGLALCTGDCVGLMHSDDFFADDHVLESVAGRFADPSIDAVYGDLDYVAKDDPTRVVRRWRSGEFSPGRLAWGWMPPHPTLYLRRSVIEQWGGFDESFRIAADYDAVLRYFLRGGVHAAYIPRVLVKMRVGGESNRSLERILLKSREDLVAIRRNGAGAIGTLVFKNLGKISQFW